jgi:hypothetical protein
MTTLVKCERTSLKISIISKIFIKSEHTIYMINYHSFSKSAE